MDNQQINNLVDELRRLRLLPQSEDVLNRINRIYEDLSTSGIDPEPIIENLNREASTKNSGIEAGLLAEMALKQNNLREQINERAKELSQQQRDIIALLVERKLKRTIAKNIEPKLSQQPDNKKAVQDSIATKPEARPGLNKAEELVDRKIRATKTSLTPQQRSQAITQLAEDFSTSTATTAAGIAILTELAIATANSQQSVIKDIDDSLKNITRPANGTDYEKIIAGQDPDISLDSTGLVVMDNSALEEAVNNLPLISPELQNELLTHITSDSYQDTPAEDPFLGAITKQQKNNALAIEGILNDPTATKVVENTIFVDTKEVKESVSRELEKKGSTASLYPRSDAAAAASFSSNVRPGQGQSNPTGLEFKGRGYSTREIEDAIRFAAKRGGRGGSNARRKRILAMLKQELPKIPEGLLPKKIPGFADSFTKSLNVGRNKLSAISGKLAPFVRAATDPVGFVQSKLAAQVGKRLAARLAGNVSNAALQQAFKIMGERGFQAGIEFLGKKAAFKLGSRFMSKAAIRALAQSLNVFPGLGLAVDAAITVALFVKDTLGKVFGQIGTSLYGKPIKVRDLAGAAGLGVAAIGGGIVTLGAAATAAMAAIFAAAGAAFMTLFFAAGAAFIFYIAAFNVGPIISTLAQLDSGLGPLGTGSGTYGTGVGAIPNNAALAECGITFASGPVTLQGGSYNYQDWPASDQQRVEDQVALLYGSSTFKSVMCRPFTFWRADDSPQGYFGWAAGNFNIVMYDGAFGSDTTLLGLLAHEMGHYYEGAARVAFKNQGFVSWGAPQTINPECSGYDPYTTRCHNNIYPIPERLENPEHPEDGYRCYEENFSEYLRFYVINSPNACNGAGHQQRLSASGYNWIKDHVFGGTVF